MYDQAENLRRQMQRSEAKIGRSIAVVSGKGGVGKSNFTINFAYALIEKGQKVLIFDMDIGMGNIHILLGESPAGSLQQYLEGMKELSDVIQQTKDGLAFISGGSGLETVMEWSESSFLRLIDAFSELQQAYDFILFDMGAGATTRVIELLVAVDEIIVLSTSEPTSITDAYSMMKFVCMKDLNKTFHLVGNRVTRGNDGQDAMVRLQYAMRKFLDKETNILGFLPEDPAVPAAVHVQRPYLFMYPNAPISKRIRAIAEVFTNVETPESQTGSERFLHKLKMIFWKEKI
ncbi:MinD/ParA family protein [Sporosarcina sp. HYO08]|uniref:MinD/ParA family protein n=1 Tax=Sporosarcina sp. HYO08 TaxID=1759557 RepID=UPI00079BE780|nr:MinD/ParA family protein [Sporosarcina sp. HYO08]KXH79999.1 ATPase [Sporosarcina sp. HYO08]